MRERLIVYQPEHLWEVTERLLHRLVLRIPKATLEILRAYGEDPFRAMFGLELDCGKLWRRESLGAGVNQPEDPWEVRERLIVYQPEHLWEVTERLLHRLVLRIPKATLEIVRAYGEDPFRAIFGLELDCGKLWRRESLGAGVNQPEELWEVRERLIVYQPEHLWEVTERLLHRLVLRTPKATLEILRAYGEDPFRATFGLELDCGKLWRRESLGAGVNQPEDPWEVRTAYCLPARAPVGGRRTAASQTSFTESESGVKDSAGVRGGPLQGDFWSRIRLWKAVARGNHWEQVSTSQRKRGR